MNQLFLARWSESLRLFLIAAALWFVGVYVVLVFFRMGYPYWLEFQEGYSVDAVMRILSGSKLYVAPSVEFIPGVYTPFYYYLSALATKVMGVGFIPLRLISFLSSLGCFGLLFGMVRKETGSRLSGFLASALFAATYHVVNFWFDLARVDPLFLFFLLASLYCIRFSVSRKGWLIAGVLMFLAFFTKQVALAAALPMGLYCFLKDRKLSLWYIVSCAALISSISWIMDVLHGGWYRYYVFELPLQHDILPRAYLTFWSKDLFLRLPIALITAILFFFIPSGKAHPDRKWFYFLSLSGLLCSSWLGRLHAGGNMNCLMPAYAGISILFGLGADAIAGKLGRIREFAREHILSLFVHSACLAQLIFLFYNPAPVYSMMSVERPAGEKLVRAMASVPGEVFAPFQGYLPVLAGKKSYAHATWIWDIMRGKNGPARQMLAESIREAFREQRFDAVFIPWPELELMRRRFNRDLHWWYETELIKFYVARPAQLDETMRRPGKAAKRFNEVIFVPRPGAGERSAL